MPPAWQCETEIVSKVIRIVESALACTGFPDGLQLQEGDKTFAKKFLEILVSQNETFANLGDDGISGISTNSILNTTTTSSIPSQVGKPGGGGGNASSKLNRLQHLELIKVGVLIFVISIIMLTTCRMIFQLFVRFRPEKPQD